MKIITKEIKDGGEKYIIYVTDLGGSPLACDYATNNNKKEVIEQFIEEFGEISIFEEMTYNEYINQ
jgi:hypothetical protein